MRSNTRRIFITYDKWKTYWMNIVTLTSPHLVHIDGYYSTFYFVENKTVLCIYFKVNQIVLQSRNESKVQKKRNPCPLVVINNNKDLFSKVHYIIYDNLLKSNVIF